MELLENLPNIGPETARQLRLVGIETPQALREAGAREAWTRILAIDPSACYNRLMGLEGAIRGIPQKQLPQDVREELKTFYQQAKA